MDFSHVTFASEYEQESILKHTKVFQNKNLFHCYHNNRGYCSFRDQCRYRHFKDICSKNVCRERECEKRHPVMCRFKEECKFNKANICAFKHPEMKTTVVSKDLELKMEKYVEEVESLIREIIDLKNDIDIKEKELLKSKMEFQESNALKQQSENDIIKENEDLKKRVDILEKENTALKIKLVEEDQINNVNSLAQPKDKDNMKMRRNHSCEKCGLHFSSKEKLNKHKDEMHRAKLTF